MHKFFVIAIAAASVACATSANAAVVRCSQSASGWCNVMPVAAPAPYRARTNVRVNVGIAAPVARPYAAVRDRRGYDDDEPVTGRGGCKNGDTRDEENGDCIKKWSPAQLKGITKIHMNSDPNCGPGLSGKIYDTLENGIVIKRRCR